MFKLVHELFLLLTPKQRKSFFSLQALAVITAVAEILGVISIVPFMSLVGNMGQLEHNQYLLDAYRLSGVSSPRDFVFMLGVVVLLLLSVGSFVSMYTTWKLSMFAVGVGSEMADRLYSFYMTRDWLFHSMTSSAQLTKQIANETDRLTMLVLLPLMQMNARIVLVVFMSIGIFLFNPIVAVTGLSIFMVAYFFLYRVVRARLQQNGQLVSDVYENRFRLMNEGFGGIKDILLLGREAGLIERFHMSGKVLAYCLGTNNALQHVPRYLMELVSFGAMVGLVLYLLAEYNGDLGAILPVMSVYALAGLKLLPAFQQIYVSLAGIKGNLSAYEAIKKDVMASRAEVIGEQNTGEVGFLLPERSIALNNVSFSYPEKSYSVLNGLSLNIPVNSVVGIVGPSGAGKSTLIDVLLGLIEPQHGHVEVDGVVVTENNKRAWQNSIGFVPQSIFLSEGTISENVAFGCKREQIDMKKVNRALELAHLAEMVGKLPEGVNSKVGERGVQLSGGQRQRIGIARALYHDANVLIFDEATSSLDGVTEKMVMEAVHDFSGQKTIIMIAHRLKTVQRCDQIFFIDEGRLVDQGTYQELIETNEQFRNMAAHA